MVSEPSTSATSAPAPRGSNDEAQEPARYNHLASSSRLTGPGDLSGTRSNPDFLVLLLDCSLGGWTAAAVATSSGASATTGAGAESDPKGKARRLDFGDGSGGAVELDKTIKDVLIFMNAHMALQHGNGIAVYATSGRKA